MPDYAGRAIAQDLSRVLGQSVIVETRSGGGGAVASMALTKAPPDGHTLLITSIGPVVLRPLMDNRLNYDAAADLTPIVLLGDAPNILAANPKLGFHTVQDAVDYAKRNPGKLTIGHSGPGTMGHLIALLFATEAGIDANLIAYQGSPPIVSDLAGGHIDIGSIAYGPAADAVSVLAVTTEERLSFLPRVPTMIESHFPNVVGSTWNAIFGPAGLPSDIVAKLNVTINAFLDKGETRRQFEALGYRILGGTPGRLRERITNDRAKWAEVIRSAKITVEP
jgi:tripartite-type tricarboxylate transporter receptor subunit TctC